jgi:hypothetical protein
MQRRLDANPASIALTAVFQLDPAREPFAARKTKTQNDADARSGWRTWLPLRASCLLPLVGAKNAI